MHEVIAGNVHHGEQPQAEDRIIAGSLLYQPITADRSATAGIAGLGDVSCRTAP